MEGPFALASLLFYIMFFAIGMVFVDIYIYISSLHFTSFLTIKICKLMYILDLLGTNSMDSQ
jgi:hypothetical protein